MSVIGFQGGLSGKLSPEADAAVDGWSDRYRSFDAPHCFDCFDWADSAVDGWPGPCKWLDDASNWLDGFECADASADGWPDAPHLVDSCHGADAAGELNQSGQ